MTRARLNHALEVIGPDGAARLLALAVARAELMAEAATLLHEAGVRVICLGGEVSEVKVV